MTTLTISLPKELKAHVEKEVKRGDYGTTSEYVRELIRKDKKRKAEEKLDALLIQGLDSDAKEMTKKDWDELRKEVRTRHARRRAA